MPLRKPASTPKIDLGSRLHALFQDQPEGSTMTVAGVLLLVLGYVLGVSVLVTLGVVLLAIGLVLLLLGSAGAGAGGRRWYW